MAVRCTASVVHCMFIYKKFCYPFEMMHMALCILVCTCVGQIRWSICSFTMPVFSGGYHRLKMLCLFPLLCTASSGLYNRFKWFMSVSVLSHWLSVQVDTTGSRDLCLCLFLYTVCLLGKFRWFVSVFTVPLHCLSVCLSMSVPLHWRSQVVLLQCLSA